MALGDNHNFTKELIEGAFSAFGRVTDAYVPEGKHFAFVTYETQEDAQKGGDSLNGRYEFRSQFYELFLEIKFDVHFL